MPRPTRPVGSDPAIALHEGARRATRRIAGHVLMLSGLGFVSLFTFVQAVARLFR